MPTISFVSPKGGAGKTTSALVLAEQIAMSAPVTIIDADPNHPIATWANGSNCPANITVVSDVDEENIIEAIEEARERTPFVLVDLEGTASKIVVYAVGMSNLVIVPSQGSQLDAAQATRSLKVVREREKIGHGKVPYGVLVTRTSPAIRTRTTAHIIKTLRKGGITIFDTELHEREAYKALFAFNAPLAHLNPKEVANIDKAVTNAEKFAAEVITMLRANAGSDEAEQEAA